MKMKQLVKEIFTTLIRVIVPALQTKKINGMGDLKKKKQVNNYNNNNY